MAAIRLGADVVEQHSQQASPLRIDLGDDAPLYIENMGKGPPDRRRVSLRWFAGSVLTGVFSAILVGGALQAAVGPGDHNIVRPNINAISADELETALGTKGDRIQPVAESELTRRVIQVSTITRMNDRDLVKVKPFAHVRAGLALQISQEFSDAVPKFNPLRLFSEQGEDAEPSVTESIYSAEVDGEVIIKAVDFPLEPVALEDLAALSDRDAGQMVRREAPFLQTGEFHTASVSILEPDSFGYAGADISATALSNAIMENVSLVEKSGGFSGESRTEDVIVTVSNGDALADLLTKNGATLAEAARIQTAMVENFSFDFRAQQKLRLQLAETGTDRKRPMHVSLYSGDDHLASVALADDDIRYIAAEAPEFQSEQFLAPIPTQVARVGKLPSVFDGIWRTGLALELPRTLIENLTRIFSLDVDYQARISASDDIELLYSAGESDAKAGEILYAAINLSGSDHQFFRFRTPDDGLIDYYDADGKSAKKFLIRKPMASGRFRSPFGMRKHPILGRFKMHTGVDWSAPRGTRIMAAGNGKVIYAKWKSGYGNHVKIQHANGYTSAYSHMSGFAKGIKQGIRVKQGQVIGFVGSTGLSTGPHLHYEVLVNKRFVNPMKIRLPRGRVLQGSVLAAFKKERERITALLEKDTGNRFANAN